MGGGRGFCMWWKIALSIRLTVSKFFFNDPRSWMDRDVIGTCSPSIFVDVREEAVVGLCRVVRDSN